MDIYTCRRLSVCTQLQGASASQAVGRAATSPKSLLALTTLSFTRSASVHSPALLSLPPHPCQSNLQASPSIRPKLRISLSTFTRPILFSPLISIPTGVASTPRTRDPTIANPRVFHVFGPLALPTLSAQTIKAPRPFAHHNHSSPQILPNS